MLRSDIIKAEILTKARELGRQERAREKAWRESPEGKAWQERWFAAMDAQMAATMRSGIKP